MDTPKRTALILEDEPLLAMEAENSLRDVGFDVSIVASCGVVEQLVNDGIPFVVHTGDVADALVGTPFEYGMWLSKPAMPEDLIAAVKQATSGALPR